jgi:hypothetical protein
VVGGPGGVAQVRLCRGPGWIPQALYLAHTASSAWPLCSAVISASISESSRQGLGRRLVRDWRTCAPCLPE